uniref:Putative multiple antibiotic resistance protein n=1 Tax=viral metagenome TaxID=1070528 RepID=A0A6H1ZCG5_9ZZZZ
MPLTTTKSNMAPGRATPNPGIVRTTNYGDLQKIATETGLDAATVQKVLDAFSSGGQAAGGPAAQTTGPRYDKPKDFTAPGVNAVSNGDAFSYTTKQGVRMNLTGAAAQAARERQNANVSNSPLSARTAVASPQATTPPAPLPGAPIPIPGGGPPGGLGASFTSNPSTVPRNAFAGAPDARSGRGTPPAAVASPQTTTSPVPLPGAAIPVPGGGPPGGLGTSFTSDKIAPGQRRQGIGPQTVPGFQDRVGMALSALSQGGGLPPGVEARYRDRLSKLLDQGEPTVGQLMQELSLTRAEAQRILQALKGGVM